MIEVASVMSYERDNQSKVTGRNSCTLGILRAGTDREIQFTYGLGSCSVRSH